MKKLEIKTKISTIALILVLALSAILVALPAANAHAPAWSIPTYAFCNASPNPVGFGQTVNVNFWVNIPPPTASGQYGDRWHNMNVIVTKPDGSKETLGPFTSDATGGGWTTYTPTEVGEYEFQMTFDGQTITDENIVLPPSAYPNIGDYYEPSESNIVSLTVQEEPIPYPKVNPLPTNYWTRPIYGENNEWYSISGAWLGLAASTFATTGMYNATGNYNPYTTAPNTAHILWTKPEAFGGIIGGEFGNSQTSVYYSTSQYEPKFAPIIIQGILYYTMYPGASTHPAGWAAVDLHTGETIWTKNTTDLLRCGQILYMVTPNQYGALAYLWSVPQESGGFMAMQTVYNMYDAMTGDYILTIENATSMTLTTDDGGNLIGYYVDSSNPYAPTLNMWNSTRCINLSPYVSNYAGGAATPDQWMWRPPQGVTIDFSPGIQWTAPLPTEDTDGNSLVVMMSMFGFTYPGYLLSLSAVQSNVVLLSGTQSSQFLFQPGWQEKAGFSAENGDLLWGPINQTEVPYSIVYSGGVWAGSGAIVELTESTLSISSYSLTTGKKLWGPTSLPNASPFSSLGANAIVANGSFYMWMYGGDVYSYNILTGDLNWEYHTPPVGMESPYGHNSIWTFTVGTIADGKLFVPEGHMYSPPLYHGAQQLALNLTTGEVVWSIDAFDVTSGPAISDGIMTTLNAYDNQIYAYSKGPSEITVSIQNDVVNLGSSVMIKGTAMDISAGAKQEGVIERFPHGLPTMSDEYMSPWMEYVYMQQPRPEDVEGVDVLLMIQDPNGDYYQTTVTSDGNGVFSQMWAPAFVGEYHVTALFEGSKSYYTSYATTTFGVDQAPATEYPDVPTADEIAQATVNRLPEYPDVPTASEVAQETINQMPAYPEMPEIPEIPEIPAYLTIDLVIIAAVVIAIIIGLYSIVKKQK